MGLCSVAGMLELQETLDFLIFQVLSLIIGSTLPDSENIWTPTGPTQSRASLEPLYWTWNPSRTWKIFKMWKNESFKIWGTKKALNSLSSCLKFIYLRLKCLPLFIICIKRTYKWIRSVYIYASNRYGMTYTTLGYDVSSELFKFELYILNRTLKWNKVCHTENLKLLKLILVK